MLSFKEALKGNQHKIDKNKNGKIDKHDFKLLRKEEQEIVEATVTTKKYSWGTMKTVHHGKDFSIPLHPEHHQAISKLKDEQEHKFKDETGRHWTARRKGEDVHFHSANDGPKTTVKHSTMSEEVDLEEEGLKDACWKGYTAVGMKMKNGKKVPNCVPVKEDKDEAGEDDDEEGEDEKEEKCDECDMPESECECECEDEMKEAKKKSMCEGKHVIGVTVSNPNHPAVTQRNEKKFRKAKVSAPDKDTAINTALAYYKKRGYKVHDHNYQGLHNEEYAESMTHEVGVSYDKNSMRAQGKVRVAAKDHDEAKTKAIDSMKGREKNVKAHSSRNLSAGKETDSVKFKEDYEMNEMRINGREYASQGVMHPDHAKMDIHKVSNQHVDFYASKTGDKMQGKVVKNDGKNVHIQAHKELGDGKLHKFKVTPNLPKKVDEATTTMSRDKKGNITSWSYSGDWKKTDPKKDSRGKVTNLAGQALKKTKELAKEETEIDEQAPVAPTLDKKYIKGTPEHKAYKATKKPINGMPTGKMKEDLDEKMDMAKADMGDVIKDFKQSDAPQFAGKSAEKRREMAIAAKLQADKEQKEERQVKNFKQFREDIYKDLPIAEEIEEIEEEVDQLDEIEFDKSGRYVHKGKYGTSYQGDDDEDDDNGKPKKPAPTGEKRGRGRPAGSTSGARQKGATAKKRSGVEYTGYPLHLPNSNK